MKHQSALHIVIQTNLFPLTDVKNLLLFINPVYKQEKWAS